jgi:ferredoxin
LPAKYHIRTRPAPPSVRPEGKLGIVEWREDCSSCHNCVKRACVYGLYADESERLRNENGFLDYIYQCRGCLSCVQNCTKNILTRVLNPEYERLGDDYFNPDIVLSTWYQAETGAIPVSGSGYGGPFSGPGFDSMWTDMSEIVRPTRDGIHGREYINTSVDIGRKPPHLVFAEGRPIAEPPPLLESPLPIMFDVLEARFDRGPIRDAMVSAAAEMGLFAVVGAGNGGNGSTACGRHVVPLIDGNPPGADGQHDRAAMVLVADAPDIESKRDDFKKERPERVVAIRVPASPAAARRVLQLAQRGVEVINLVFDAHGRETAPAAPRHMRDVIREVHTLLTEQGVRDEVTLVSSGGIAMAEHVAKAVICGVDLVAVDRPLVVALECRLCGECARGSPCPVTLEEISPEYAVQRIVNLMGAWHSQLIEMLGAMGIREVRRLRGEVGRCMFFEDLEKNTFGRLFGNRKRDPEATTT